MNQKIWNWLRQHSSFDTYVEKIYVREDKEKAMKRIWRQRGRIIVILLGVLVAAIVLCMTQENGETPLTEGRFLERKDCEETVTVTVKGEKEGKRWERKIALPISERELSAKEMKVLDHTVASYLTKTLPGKNKSLHKVKTALVLNDSMPEKNVRIQWMMDDTYIGESGQIRSQQIPAEGVVTEGGMEPSGKKDIAGGVEKTVHKGED